MRTMLRLATLMLCAQLAFAGPTSTALRDTSEWIVKKFGAGAAGRTVDEVAVATAKVVARHGEEALPLLRSMGHAGFEVLEQAGERSNVVLKFFGRRGEEAAWLVAQPSKLKILLQHGEAAADALLKHPGIADDLVARFGSRAVAPLNALEREGAQRMAMAAREGLFEAAPQSGALLDVIGKYGQRAMDFIWRNKGALATGAVLVTFLQQPEAYINGAKQLVGDSIIAPIVRSIQWSPIAYGMSLFAVGAGALWWWRRSRGKRGANSSTPRNNVAA
jgi:hypothetical protein